MSESGNSNEPSNLPPAPLVRRFSPPEFGQQIPSPNGNIYTFTGQIGEGHFSIVYGCTDLWRNDLAAKIFKPLGRPYDTVGESVVDEVSKLLQLRHPNVTYIYDAFEHNDTYYVITERCHQTLHDLFRIPDFDGKLWFHPVARCLLQGIEYIHRNRYVHQDLHFGNVMCSFLKDEMVSTNFATTFKIADLGISKLIHQLAPENTRAQWLLPPEVLNPGEYGPIDHRIDIYHAGLILLQFAYSAELTFTSDQVLNGDPRRMALDLGPPYSLGLEKALRRHVSFRTETARELWRDINTPPVPTGLPLLDFASN